MTNGEKFKQIFSITQVDDCDLNVYAWLPIHDAIEIPVDWWNAEYKEPTTKNNLGVTSELEKNSKKLEKDFGELDCISREQAQTEIEMNASRYTIAEGNSEE